MKEIQYDNRDIISFCISTGDDNSIHDPQYMEPKSKRVIVPGMLTLTDILNNFPTDLKKTRSILANFGYAVSEGDIIRFDDEDISDVEKRIITKAHDNPKKEDTHIFMNREIPEIEYLGETHKKITFSPHQAELFAKVLGTNITKESKFLYSLALSSRALLESKEDLKLSDEKKLSDILGNKLPAYQSISINLPKVFPDIHLGKQLNYYMSVSSEDEKHFQFDIQCIQGLKEIYNGRYELLAVPEKLVMRMARDL
ncbi:hypothetical protein C0585_08320 [Candidatus Woesearchaeota archaeon]|nr:MAG: hypothetical protein C0585_08320 [Candidatus Woesearchaeota archaeon]